MSTHGARAAFGLVASIVALLLTGCVSVTPPPEEPVQGAPAPQSSQLVRLRVESPAKGRPRYVRDEWQPHGWADADSDGCNTRQEVLISESRAPVQRREPGCKILTGDWLDPYTGVSTGSPAELQIDHLVALADAHRSGGWAWPAAKKVAFANDLSDAEMLNAVSGRENERKADDGPDRWSPPNSAFKCAYVAAYARIKAKWDLSVTPDQNAAIGRLWKGCPSGAGQG